MEQPITATTSGPRATFERALRSQFDTFGNEVALADNLLVPASLVGS